MTREMRLIPLTFLVMNLSLLPGCSTWHHPALREPSNALAEESVSTELDISYIRLSDDMRILARDKTPESEQKAMTDLHLQIWPGGILRITFVDSRDDKNPYTLIRKINSFMAACEGWSQIANVQCQILPYRGKVKLLAPQLTVEFGQTSGVSWATVGYQSEYETSNLFGTYISNDADEQVMAHELGHVWGFQHEHQRPDRDQYIRIFQENIDPNHLGAFAPMFGSYFLSPEYDYNSIMHYKNRVFSKNNQNTMEARANPTIFLGPVDEKPSAVDAKRMRDLYGPPMIGRPRYVADKTANTQVIFKACNGGDCLYSKDLSNRPDWYIPVAGEAVVLFSSPTASRKEIFECYEPSVEFHFVSFQSNCEGKRLIESLGFVESQKNSYLREIYNCVDSRTGAEILTMNESDCAGANITDKSMLGFAPGAWAEGI